MAIGGPTPIKIMEEHYKPFLDVGFRDTKIPDNDKKVILNIFINSRNEKEFNDKIVKSPIKSGKIKEAAIYLLQEANGSHYKEVLERLKKKSDTIQEFINKHTGGVGDFAGEVARKAAARKGPEVR